VGGINQEPPSSKPPLTMRFELYMRRIRGNQTLKIGGGVEVGVEGTLAVAVSVSVGDGPGAGDSVGVGDIGGLVGVGVDGIGVGVGVGVEVLVGVGVEVEYIVGIKHHSFNVPTNAISRSAAVSAQLPLRFSPSNALNGLFGINVPSIVGTPNPHSSSTGLAASSSRIASMSVPEQPKVEAGTPGRSIMVTVVPVSTCSKVKTRSPTQVWEVLMETFRSERVPAATTGKASVTPVGSPSGIGRAGALQKVAGVGDDVGVIVGVGVGPVAVGVGVAADKHSGMVNAPIRVFQVLEALVG
jgi:hypothetical protein